MLIQYCNIIIINTFRLSDHHKFMSCTAQVQYSKITIYEHAMKHAPPSVSIHLEHNDLKGRKSLEHTHGRWLSLNN